MGNSVGGDARGFDVKGIDPFNRGRHLLLVSAAVTMLAVAGFALRAHDFGEPNSPMGPIGRAVVVVVTVGVLLTAFVMFALPLAARFTYRRFVTRCGADGEARRWLADDPRPVIRARMRTLLVIAFGVAAVASVAAAWLSGRGDVRVLGGLAVGLVLLGMCGYLGVIADPPGDGDAAGDGQETLQRWVFRTESMIRWSETTRSDWDRRVRPILSRQFEMATKANQRRTTDPASFHATGRMVFGADLWPWVDPDNVDRAGSAAPGPGRRVLEELIGRLEQV